MKFKEPEMCAERKEATPLLWHAMSAPYRRELIACERFSKAGFECFLPLKRTLTRKKSGKTEIRQLPVVPNLIFVRGRRPDIQSVKAKIAVAQYLTRREGDRNIPITIPDREMSNFRLAFERAGENVAYIDPSEIDLRKGSRVRIVGGVLDGLEGVFIKVKGARSRRLVVMLEGVTALAAEVEPDYVQIID